MFGIKKPALYAIINIYKSENRVTKKLKGGNRKKALSGEHIQFLKNWIDEDASITLKSLQAQPLERFGLSVSIKTVDNYIDEFSYSLKTI